MHELRANLTADDTATPTKLIASKRGKNGTEGGMASLTAIPVQRTESRSVDQRREDRQRDLVNAATIHFRRRKIDVNVVNVSSRGVMIESGIEPFIGERIDIQFADCNRTTASVRWLRKGRIGLEFADETAILASLKLRREILGAAAMNSSPAEPESSRQRPMYARSQRHGLTWTGTLYWTFEAFPVRLRNISADGAMLEGECNLQAGAKVRLNLEESGTVAGEVRWCQGGQIGVKFDEPFDLKNLAHSRPAAPVAVASNAKPSNSKRSIWKIRF